MSDKSHLGGAYEQGDGNTYCVDVFGWLLVAYDPKFVLDLGAGYGHALKWFADHGLCNITGIEGCAEYVEKSLIGGNMMLHDFNDGPAPIATPFDLALAFEFVEHVDEQYIPNYMQAFRLARHACITHAEPGQHGHHHVSCFSDSWWIAKFAEYGFEHDAEETALLRRTDRWRAPWGRRTLMMFHRV